LWYNVGMKKLIKIAIGILCVGIIIIATDFGLLWLPLEHSPEYPTKVAALFMAVTALVTLLLALTAVRATEQSNFREKNRRTDEIEKENRDRKERLLNEIIEWAIDVRASAIGKEINLAFFKGKDLVNALYVGLNKYRGKSSYIEKIALKFDKDLQDAVKNASTELKKCLDSLVNCLKIPKTKSIDFDEPARHAVTLEQFADKVIEEATKIKVSLLDS